MHSRLKDIVRLALCVSFLALSSCETLRLQDHGQLVPDDPVAQCQAHPASIFPGYVPPGDEPEEEDTFVITGSRIARADLSSERPVIISGSQRLPDPLINGSGPRTSSSLDHHHFRPTPWEILARQEAAAQGIPYIIRSPVFRPDIEIPLPAATSSTATFPAHENSRYFLSQADVQTLDGNSISAFSAHSNDNSYYRVRNQLKSCSLRPQYPDPGEMVSHFSYGYDEPVSANEPLRPTVWLTPSPWSDETKLLHIGIRAFDVPQAERPPLNLVFLISAAGLRMFEGGLGIEQFGLMTLLDDLRPNDRISIVTYVPIGTHIVLEPTPVRMRSRIEDAILNAGNRDHWEEVNAIETAYDFARQEFSPDQVNHIIHSTGWAYGLGFSDSNDLYQYVYQNRLDGIHFNTLRFGSINIDIEQASSLAYAGDGFSDHIGSVREYRDVLDRHIVGARPRVAENVSYQVEFNPAAVTQFRNLGNYSSNGDYEGSERVLSKNSITAIYEVSLDSSSLTNIGEGIASLQIRYSLPGQDAVRTVQQPIHRSELVDNWDDAHGDARFAAVVGAFGRAIQYNSQLAGLDLNNLYDLAESGLGEDIDGERQKFLDLIRLRQILNGEISPY